MGSEQLDLAELRATGGGHRRYVTVLFSDVSGSSEHAERLEAEDYAAVLERFRQFARDVIPRHGGSIARMQGDGVLALFGHIEPREDDGRRAAEAALELHDAVAQLHVGRGDDITFLQMHSGIHAGLVLVIEGDIERGRFDVVGEVPNTAARLCSMADKGEILISEETLGPQTHFFKVKQLSDVAVRGRSETLNVVQILGRATVERRIDAAARRGVVPFVGRAPAFKVLSQCVGQVKLGKPSAVIVSGEAGIGKTRLIDEFQARTESLGFVFLSGYCESYLGAEPLQPFLHVVRGALGWRQGLTPIQNEAQMQPLWGLEEDIVSSEILAGGLKLLSGREKLTPADRVRLIVDFISRLSRQVKLVLVLDDWQWADDASRQVLDRLQAQELALLTILAVRTGVDDDIHLEGAELLRLEPLDVGAAEEAISAWLPDVEPFLAQEIFKQSGGSPLFIEELCHAAAASGSLPAMPKGSGIAWINALLGSRLSRLPLAQAEILRVASVIGNVFSTSLLEKLLGADDLGPTLETLAAQDFLVADGQPGYVRFKHAMTRDAVYGTIEPVQRRAVHLRVAGAIESLGVHADAFDAVEALAYHYDAAGINERAAYFAEAAGDKALAAMALDRARGHYIMALRALDALPVRAQSVLLRWCSIAEKLGQTCVFDPLDVSHGLVLFERAAMLARESGDKNAIARAEYWLAYVNYGKGQARAAVRHSEAALEHAVASGDERLVAQVQSTLGQSLASAGQYERALPLLKHSVESKRQQSRPGSGTAIGSAYTLGRMAYTLGDLGQFDEAYAKFDESLHLLGDKLHSVRASVRELMCVVYLWQGRWAEAQEAGFEGSDIALRCRSRYLTAMGRALGACGAWAMKQDLASFNLLHESTQWIDARGGAVSTSLNHGWLVDASVTLGMEREARQHAARLFMRSRAQDRHGEAIGCRALARLAEQQGDVPRAFGYLDRADQAATYRASARELAVNRLARAALYAGRSEVAKAKELAGQSIEDFDRMKMQSYRAQAHDLLQRL
ncbi:MAG: AAA family ATPase [Betaproteobacteria bacterium]|nr:AAA family ATPase [Betaproteobacteria bacterium]